MNKEFILSNLPNGYAYLAEGEDMPEMSYYVHTYEEIAENELNKKRYILSKIKNYQDTKIRAQQELITGLPAWESEYDIIHSKSFQ